MVDIKREDITLQDWTKGISADEFAWGSYFYSEAISSWYNSKGFELWYSLEKTKINSRLSWYAKALAIAGGNGFVAFTNDGMVEMEVEYNGEGKGAYYANFIGDTYRQFYNWVDYGRYLFGITYNSVKKIPAYSFFSSTQLLTNPDLSSATWWTLWTWWTTTDAGAKHTPWSTDTLVSDAVTWTNLDQQFRLAFKITWWTAGTINVKEVDAFNITYVDRKDWWYVVTIRWAAAWLTVTFTPNSAFDGTIERVELYKLNLSEYAEISITWNNSPSVRPALVWEWDLYVAWGSYVNIINLGDNWVISKQLIDSNFNIVSMNQQAWNIILWATDGHDSRQYYWNWVDAVATEVIEWKGLIIQSACGTETISYVLTTSWATSGTIDWYEYRLYAVSGYQRNLIASKLFQYRSDYYINWTRYNRNKKFDFNDVTNEHWMIVFLDSLYAAGCDGLYKYWYDIPWLRSNRTRPVKYDTWGAYIVLWQRWHYLGIGYRANNINYIGKVENRLYQPTWYLVTEAIYRDKLSTRKALEKLKIWYKNVASTVGNIKVYAIVDDNYFRRFRPTATPTVRPSVWDVYNVANNTTAKVIDVDIDNNVITLVTVSDTGSYDNLANTTLTKVSGDWDDSITVSYNYDNMCLIKTIESEQQWYDSDLIFWKDFVNTYLPYRHKIQFVIELNSNDNKLSPEIYEISMISDITDTVL